MLFAQTAIIKLLDASAAAARALQERGGGLLSWLSGFFWSCISIFAIVYTMTTGQDARVAGV